MASLMAGSSGTWPALFQRWPGRSRRKSPQPCGTAEFAENSEFNSDLFADEDAPTPVLRPKRGKVRGFGRKPLRRRNSEFFHRFSEFFRNEQRIRDRNRDSKRAPADRQAL